MFSATPDVLQSFRINRQNHTWLVADDWTDFQGSRNPHRDPGIDKVPGGIAVIYVFISLKTVEIQTRVRRCLFL